MVKFYSAYFDESYLDDGSLFVLSGYVFEKEQAEIFSDDWKSYLKTLELAYAHQVDCVHRSNQYAKLSKEQCDLSARTLIEQIKRRTIGSVSVGINLKEYNAIIKPKVSSGRRMSAYTFLLMVAVTKATQLISEYDSKVSFLFEAGHPNQSEADRYMAAAMKYPLSETYPISSYGFYRKDEAIPLQAADMLAWQYRKYLADIAQGKRAPDNPRADFRALARLSDIQVFIDREYVQIAREYLDRLMPHKTNKA